MTEENWSVEIRVNGENILHISHNELSGVENICEYADTVRMIARQLVAFIGKENSDAEF